MPPDPTSTAPRSTEERHFAFGENWARYAALIGPETIKDAESALCRLVGQQSLEGLSFLDVGSGSGLHSLAALRLGCRRVLAIDIDGMSVETTRKILTLQFAGDRWECRQESVFDLDPGHDGVFDIVYAWGVLHHTGAMFEAIAKALGCVAPGGLAVLALYRKTRLCGFWRWEKRWYSRAPGWAQAAARGLYIGLHGTSMVLRGRSVRRHIADYPKANRGMDYFRDVHDWLGGHPYESLTPEELEAFMADRGFRRVRAFVRPGGLGLLGSGNDEYAFERVVDSTAPPG